MKRSLIDLGRAKIPQDEAEFLWLVTLTSHFAIFSLYGRILFGTPVPSVVLAIASIRSGIAVKRISRTV